MVTQDSAEWCVLCQSPHSKEDPPYWDILNHEEPNYENLNMARDSYHLLANNPKDFKITPEEMKAMKEKSLDAQSIRISITQNLDEQAKEEIKKKRYLEYQRKNKVLPDQPKSWTKVTLPIETNPSPSQEIKLNVDLVASLSKMTIPIPLVELLNILE